MFGHCFAGSVLFEDSGINSLLLGAFTSLCLGATGFAAAASAGGGAGCLLLGFRGMGRFSFVLRGCVKECIGQYRPSGLDRSGRAGLVRFRGRSW